MKFQIIVLTLFIAFGFVPPSLHAFYQDEGMGAVDQPVPMRVIIKLNSDVDASLVQSRAGTASIGIPSFDAINEKYGIVNQELLYPSIKGQQRSDLIKNTYFIDIPVGAVLSEIIIDYKKLEIVEYAHPDWQAQLYDIPNDSLYNHQWALNNTGQGYYHVLRRLGNYNDTLVIEYGTADADIDAHEVFEVPPDNTNTVIVAIVDTGIDLDHPDLVGRLWTNAGEIPGNGIDDDHNGYIDDVLGWDYSGDDFIPPVEDNDPTDIHGHGTHCAGIVTAVAGNELGVAGIIGDCQVMALKFSSFMLSSYAAQAIVYAADNGADVISMSFGYPWPVEVLDDALAYAHLKGVILCAAAGNDGIEYLNYPAASPDVITVGATTSSDLVTDFSTFGNHLEISAPGLSVLSLRADFTDMYESHMEPYVHIIDEYYYLASGTSMACPHVAGVAAYLRALSPGLTPDQAQEIIQSTADDIIDPYGMGGNYPGWDKYSGYGRVNLYNATAAVPLLRAIIDVPVHNQIVSDIIGITGSADGDDFSEYILEYGSGSTPDSWIEILTSSTPVTGGILGQWNTTGLNGQYTIRIRVGESNVTSVTVYVANTTAVTIFDPSENDTIISSTVVAGTATSPDFEYCILEYGVGETPSTWVEIAAVSIPVVEDEIAVWNTSGLSEGWYTLRLSLYTTSKLQVADSILVFVQSLFSGENAWKITFDSTISIVTNYGDFDNDGVNEILLGTWDGILFFNPDGTPKTTGIPEIPSYDFRVPIAVGSLDGDSIDDFVAIAVTDGNESKLLGFPSSEPSFEVDIPRNILIDNFTTDQEFLYPTVFLKDIDGDGRDEIHVATGFRTFQDSYYCVYNSDGSFKIEIPPAFDFVGHFSYLSSDLNNDSTDEFYTCGYILYQLDTSGVVQNSFDLRMGQGGDFRTLALTSADIDNDGKLNLITLGNFEGTQSNFLVFAFDENLDLIPGWPHDTGINNYLCPAAPLFADIDMDGNMEYFIDAYELMYGFVYAWNVDGTPYTGDSAYALFASTPNPSKLYSPVIADMDGDQFPDLVVCAEPDVFLTNKTESLAAWDKNGNMLAGWPVVTVPQSSCCKNAWIHIPTVGDINNDGYVDVIMTTVGNNLVFINFEDATYYPETSPLPSWRYNRRMNYVMLPEPPAYVCGDADGNSIIEVSDAIFLINYVFFPGSPAPEPYLSGDCNCDELVDISDATYIIVYIFEGGPEPCADCPQ